MKKIKIAIFASGSGSNAQKIIEHFEHHPQIEVALILSNSKDAYVLQRAEKFGIPSLVFNKNQFKDSLEITDYLQNQHIDFIVLAGFLWLIPKHFIQAYPNKIVNIHPSLLPKYGGKGMYGDYVHQAVLDHGESKSGITIHYVNEHFDEGAPIFQASFDIEKNDSLEEVREKCHALEHLHFSKVIEDTILTSF